MIDALCCHGWLCLLSQHGLCPDSPPNLNLTFHHTWPLPCTLMHTRICMSSPLFVPSVRNCPWVGELWVRYLRAMERGGASSEEQGAAFELALAAGIQVRCACCAVGNAVLCCAVLCCAVLCCAG